jgi:hypothetical protein
MKQNETNNPNIQIQMGQTIQIQSKHISNSRMSYDFMRFPGFSRLIPWLRPQRFAHLGPPVKHDMMKYDEIQ